ncbi:hypothetical protein RJZ56_000713 [Blastomyces dermatitidis]
MSKSENNPPVTQTVDDDEPDEWYEPSLLRLLGPGNKVSALDWSANAPIQFCRDKRIFSTGCAAEQLKMNDCYYEKRDWRACKKEMEAFRECWKRHGNEQRTESKDS